MGAGGGFAIAATLPPARFYCFPPPALRFYGKARVIQAINQMLGPAGAICGVSPPRHPTEPPLPALAAGDITPPGSRGLAVRGGQARANLLR